MRSVGFTEALPLPKLGSKPAVSGWLAWLRPQHQGRVGRIGRGAQGALRVVRLTVVLWYFLKYLHGEAHLIFLATLSGERG